MHPFILIGIAALIVILILRNLLQRDLPAEQCAGEVIDLLRQNKDASANQILTIFQSHQRTTKDIGKVTRLIKPRLTQAHILKDDQNDVMINIRKAKSLLKNT